MSKIDPRLIGECATWLSIISQLFGTKMARLLEPYGMTLGQFSILHHIVRPELNGGSRISEIAQAVEVGQPAVTKAISKFENMGLIKLINDPVDKRAKTVVPLPAAHELLGKIRMGIGPDLTQVFSALNANELEGFAKNLKQLGQWLDENR